MNESEVSTAPETQNPAPEATQTPAAPEATDSAGQTATETEAKPERTPQEELAYLRKKATKADRNNSRLSLELQQAREQLARIQPQSPPAEQQNNTPRDIETAADQLVRQREFQAKVAKTITDGRKEFPDFDQATNEVVQDLGEAVIPYLLALETPHKVIKHLASEPDLLDELASMPLERRALRLGQIERELSVKPIRQPSSAPKPLEPVQTTASADGEPDPDRNPEGWIAWRNKNAKRR